jgi:hypothetical protein
MNVEINLGKQNQPEKEVVFEFSHVLHQLVLLANYKLMFDYQKVVEVRLFEAC